MFFLAYFGYLFFFFDEAYYEHSMKFENLKSLSYILFIGGLITALFTFVGYSASSKLKYILLKTTDSRLYSVVVRNNKLRNTIFLLSFFGMLLMAFAYIKMGFIPILSENPMVAKFFANEYQEAYRPVAPFFRMGLNILILAAPFLVLYSFTNLNKNKLLSMFTLLFVFLFLLSTMRRGPIGMAFVYILMLFSIYYKNGKYIVHFFVINFIIFSLGSAFNGLLFYLIGASDTFSILEIFHGVPDIVDLFWFWDSFQNGNNEFAFGRTIYGGLIPYHYEWNPGNYTKIVIGGTGNEASGGFRLPEAVWGYVNFGWIGVLIWSAWNGFIAGIRLKLTKVIILKYKDNLFHLFIAFFIFNLYYDFISKLLGWSIDALFSFVIGLYLITFFKFNNKGKVNDNINNIG